MNPRYDVCIIGGGAAGLAAAVGLDREIRTCIIEKNQILGRKILATGGGRCNLSNAGCRNVSATLDFFASLGLESICDSEGRFYPYSGCASDVVRVLEDAVHAAGTDVFTDHTVERIERVGGCEGVGGFRIHSMTYREAPDAETHLRRSRRKKTAVVTEARLLLIASGGKAAPQLGTSGDGYRFARDLGHQTTRLYPILTGIETAFVSRSSGSAGKPGSGSGDNGPAALKGIRARGRVSLRKDGRQIAAETGEIQFTEDGLSGICIFNLTPLIHTEEGERPEQAFRRYELALDLAPDFSQEQIQARITAGASSFGILNERLAAVVGLDQIKDWRLPVLGIKGWKQAQCTAGGIRLEEVDLSSMESRLVPGLYFAGEILDMQGPCGGYNLQNAWETGLKAAAAIREAVMHSVREE